MLAPAGDAAAKKKKTTPQIKLFTGKAKTTKIPGAENKTGYFLDSQKVYTKCGRGYTPLSIGIASGSSSFAAEDIYSGGVGVIADGAAGTATTKLEVLCVRGGKAPYYFGKSVTLDNYDGGLVVTATLKCKPGYAALGAALAQGYPAEGRSYSMPMKANEWKFFSKISRYNADAYAGKIAQLGYPRAACVRATGVSIVKQSLSVGVSGLATTKLNCTKGRALGWGVDLLPFTPYPSSDRWATPLIQQAHFTGKSSMSFSLMRGIASGYQYPTGAEVALICGKLPKG
jgi:hypothetical protein